MNSQQLAAAIESGRSSDPISSLLDAEIVHTHPDHPSETVLERLAQSGRVLPIVSRDDAQRVVGVVTLPQITRFLRKQRGPSATTSVGHATVFTQPSQTRPGP